MAGPGQLPEGVDTERPSVARLYDYFLGGAHNFAVDRELAAQMEAKTPVIRASMRANRDFLRRAVRFLAAQGIDQFLDIGSGIPTVGNVHEVAKAVNPDAHVVYVDIDPVAVAHGQSILADDPNSAVFRADARDVDVVLHHATTRQLIDLTRPVAVLLVAVLHFIPDADDPHGLVHGYLDAAAPGSHLALSHGTLDGQSTAFRDTVRQHDPASGVRMRSRSEIAALLEGLELIPPGIVPLPQWRPDGPADAEEDPNRHGGYAVVARTRG